MYTVELSILLHRALESRVASLQERLAIPGWQEQPEPLHQVRVISRRVRAVLDLLDQTLYPAFERQSRTVRKLTRALGRTREMDVHGHLLEAMEPELAHAPGPASAALEYALEQLDTHKERARLAMAKDLDKLSLKRLDQLLVVPTLSDPFAPGNPGAEVWDCLAPWVERAFEPMAGLLEREDGTALHELRIDVKRLRYTLEILAPAFVVEPLEPLKLLKGLQGALGDHHDLATLEDLLRLQCQDLGARRRLALVAGLEVLLNRVHGERLAAFERFRSLVRNTSPDAFRDSLKALLLPREGAPPQ